MGELVSIVYKPEQDAPAEGGFLRVPLTEATLTAGHGIAGDAKGGTRGRHLNIMAAETAGALGSEGFQAQPGQLGEQLLVTGIELDTLPAGAQLQIGPSARVVVTEPRTGCAKFERWQDKPRELAKGRLGVMAEVVADGPIRPGDPVVLLEQA